MSHAYLEKTGIFSNSLDMVFNRMQQLRSELRVYTGKQELARTRQSRDRNSKGDSLEVSRLKSDMNSLVCELTELHVATAHPEGQFSFSPASSCNFATLLQRIYTQREDPRRLLMVRKASSLGLRAKFLLSWHLTHKYGVEVEEVLVAFFFPNGLLENSDGVAQPCPTLFVKLKSPQMVEFVLSALRDTQDLVDLPKVAFRSKLSPGELVDVVQDAWTRTEHFCTFGRFRRFAEHAGSLMLPQGPSRGSKDLAERDTGVGMFSHETDTRSHVLQLDAALSSFMRQ